MNVIKPEYVRIRDAFPHEALDFTIWLADNIDVLSKRLGIELVEIEREKSVGSFNVDLKCTDKWGNAVIIENQLEPTNHDHLGKLLTYMFNLDAKIAIWVATEVRPEHQRVIDRLNEIAADEMAFYFVQVEAIRTGVGQYVPIFTVLARPDEQTREIGKEKKEQAAREVDQLREEFWTQLLQKASNTRFGNIKPSRHSYIQSGAGKTGVTFRYVVYNNSAEIDLYIDNDKDTGEGNKLILRALEANSEQIEAEFGGILDWRSLDDNRASRIVIPFEGRGLQTPDDWDQLQNEMIDTMTRFDATLRKHIQRLEV